jgi:hypothetical protein
MPNTSIQFLKRFCPSPVIIFSWFFCNIKAVSIFFDPPFVSSLNRKAVIFLFMLIFNYTHFELWKNEHLNSGKVRIKILCLLWLIVSLVFLIFFYMVPEIRISNVVAIAFMAFFITGIFLHDLLKASRHRE